MPGVPVPPDRVVMYRIGQNIQLAQSLAKQQQNTITNALGQAVINTGLIPGSSPAAYGLQFVDPATGGQLALFGEVGSSVGLYYYDPSTGTKVSQYDGTGLHFYNSSGVETVRIDGNGVHVYDASSNNRVNAGELSNGDYGLQVIDVDGNSEEILPTVFDGTSGPITTSSATFTHATGSPAVTVDIGANGKASVWIGAQINASGAGLAFASILIGGSNPATAPEVAWPFTAEGTQYATSVVTGLTPGSTTFDFAVASASGTATFAAMELIVQPL